MQPVVLLDGGLGQEIYRRARSVSSPLWSVAVMQEQPEVVTAVHADFIRAGAKNRNAQYLYSDTNAFAQAGHVGAVNEHSSAGFCCTAAGD